MVGGDAALQEPAAKQDRALAVRQPAVGQGQGVGAGVVEKAEAGPDPEAAGEVGQHDAQGTIEPRVAGGGERRAGLAVGQPGLQQNGGGRAVVEQQAAGRRPAAGLARRRPSGRARAAGPARPGRP